MYLNLSLYILTILAHAIFPKKIDGNELSIFAWKYYNHGSNYNITITEVSIVLYSAV